MNNRKIITFFFLIIPLFIGYFFLSGRYSNVKQSKQAISQRVNLPTFNTKCSTKQLYQKNILNQFIINSDTIVSSLSGEIKQIEDLTYSKPTKTIEEFKKGLSKPTEVDDEFYNRTIQEEYNKYLQKTGEVLTKGLVNIQKTKDSFILPKKAQLEKLIRFKNALSPFIDKLKKCEGINRTDLQQQLESSEVYNKEGIRKLLVILFETKNEKEIFQKAKEFKSLTSTPSPK